MAVLKHELRIYFNSLTACFRSLPTGLCGARRMLYNLQGLSQFEFVLSFGSMIFVVIVPI